MRKIYLASNSKARKQLLKLFGFKFKVLASRVKEERRPGSSYVSLVKRNALSKARDVARRVKNGVIIAADTIMVQDGKVFGKPKNLKDAYLMLKRLSSSPQWVYTGIAVIDKDKNKPKVDYEKTKVYMDKLSVREIKDYFKSVSPLDKAGSFDIQGKGAFFIRRIEGCFYNVVGLPLRKLYKMLKAIGVGIFAVAFCLILSGCSTEYNLVTKEQEIYFYSTDKEVAMGEAINKEVEKQSKPAEDPLMQKRVEDIGKKIAAVCDRKDITYHFKVIEDKEFNAFSLPGGYVYVNTGLLEKVASDDELAGVLGHEIGHIVARHSIKRLQAMMGYSLLRVIVAQAPNAQAVGEAADIIFSEKLLGYSREDELLADQLATRYLKSAGYDPYAMITFLKKMQDIDRRKPLGPKTYAKTHPYIPDRIRVVKQELDKKMDFDDYINIEQNAHK